MANLAPSWRPKRLQNRGQNLEKSMLKNETFLTSIFSWFGIDFGRLRTLKIELSPRREQYFWKSQFSLGKINIFKVFAKMMFVHFSCVPGPKNLPKTLPKRGPNPSKIDAKNVLLFNIDFFGFRPRFWRVLGLQLGAKLAILAPKNYRARLTKRS